MHGLNEDCPGQKHSAILHGNSPKQMRGDKKAEWLPGVGTHTAMAMRKAIGINQLSYCLFQNSFPSLCVGQSSATEATGTSTYESEEHRGKLLRNFFI